MKRLKSFIAITAAVLTGALAMQATVYAESESNPQTLARHNRIVGLWDVQVTVTNCANGAPLATFPALHKYELGGTGQVVPGTNPAGLSAHMVIWNHVEGNTYQMAIKFFRFDAVGNRIGWAVLNNEISIDEDAEVYSGSGVSQSFDNTGNLVGGGCPIFTGTRFTGE